ncbi:LytR/AlgR family response regulator transcription factor [Lacrimispora sp. JR3]|uniref:LytR/AlgR family response regulator transcription factor n=1 Tax=Lacrimispora sinapis TaxID=3111456 RepID=UPI003747888E
MKIAVCDDNILFQEEIKNLLYEYFGRLSVEIKLFSNGMEFLRAVQSISNPFDLVFMDIEMPGIDGLETSRQLRKKNRDLFLIFLSSHTELAFDGYEVDAFRFLTKPVKRDKLWKALSDWEKSRLSEERICFNLGDRSQVLSWSEIQYIQSENVYVNVVTVSQRILVRMKMKELEKKMPESMFFKPHRSYLVNLKHILSFDSKKIRMADGLEVPLSRRHAAEFRNRMMKFLNR